ncbi:Unknown protein sequence [Pseudomonas syringae pv. aceris]|nr:Unknown protein sequence [Pseudomonas syringae pv. aceris]
MTTRTRFNVLPLIDLDQCLAVGPDLTIEAIISRTVEENAYSRRHAPRDHI